MVGLTKKTRKGHELDLGILVYLQKVYIVLDKTTVVIFHSLLTLNSSCGHSSRVQTELHWQTSNSGKDASHLSSQHRFSIVEINTRQEQSLESISSEFLNM